MENIPFSILILFAFTTFLSVGFFFRAAHRSGLVLALILAWLAIQSIIGFIGFYLNTNTTPPRFLLLVPPAISFVVIFSFTVSGKKFLDGLDIRMLTLLHVVRLPVEIVLFYVFKAKLIPELMTFEGANFDVISGLSAPIMYYLVFISKSAGKRVLLFWNIICSALLVNVLTIAAFSATTPFQQFGFDQPNIGVGYFPFVLLPAIIVPIVLISHLAAIRQLLKR